MEWREFGVIGGIYTALLGWFFRLVWSKAQDAEKTSNKMEEKMRQALYKDDGMTIYMPRADCITTEARFCSKLDDIKLLIEKQGSMIEEMNRSREAEKDDYHEYQKSLALQIQKLENAISKRNVGERQ